MAYSCWAALSATYRTLSRSLPKGRCGPCFSMMPNGKRHVPCARAMPSRNSAADSSSQCTESLGCAGDCAHAIDTIGAPSTLMDSSNDLYKGPPAKVIGQSGPARRLVCPLEDHDPRLTVATLDHL